MGPGPGQPCQVALPLASEHRMVLGVLGRVGSRPLWLPHRDALGRACMAVVRPNQTYPRGMNCHHLVVSQMADGRRDIP